MSAATLRRSLAQLAEIPATAIAESTARIEQVAAETGRPVTVKGKRYVLTATSKIERRGADELVATVQGKPAGYWVWQNTGTKPHEIKPARGERHGRPKVLAIKGGHPQSVPVHHRGATGRGRWREVQRRARLEVPRIFRETVDDAVRKVG